MVRETCNHGRDEGVAGDSGECIALIPDMFYLLQFDDYEKPDGQPNVLGGMIRLDHPYRQPF